MILTQCLSEWVSPSWRAPKRPAEPSTASPMNQSSPNTHCHFLTLTHFWPRRSSKMSMIHLVHCSVSSSVFCSLSNIQPRISFRWFQPLSPFLSFFSNRYGFLLVHGICIPLGEHLVNGVHDALPDVAALVPGRLSEPDEVVDEDINVCDWPQEDQEGCMVSQLRQQSRSG